MTTGELAALEAEAFAAFDRDDLTTAAALYEQIIARVPEATDPAHRGALHMLAFTRAHQGDFGAARALYDQLLRWAQAEGDAFGISTALHQLGMVDRLAGDYPAAAARFAEEAAFLTERLPEFLAGQSANAYERGLVRLLSGDAAGAEPVLHEALRLGEAAADAMCQACALHRLGTVSRALKQHAAADGYYARAVDMFRAAGDERGAQMVLAERGG